MRRTAGSTLALAAFTILSLTISPQSFAAADHGTERTTGQGVEVAAGATPPSPAVAAPGETTPELQVIRTPACRANTPTNLARGIEVSCSGAINGCPPGQILVTTYTSPAGLQQWTNAGTSCLSSDDHTTGTPVPAVTEDDERRPVHPQ